MTREEIIAKAEYIQFPNQHLDYFYYEVDGKDRIKLEFDKDCFYPEWGINAHHIQNRCHFNVTVPALANLFSFNFNPNDFHFESDKFMCYDLGMPHPNNEPHIDIIPHQFKNVLHEQRNVLWNELLVPSPLNKVSKYHDLYKYAHMCSTVINHDFNGNEKNLLVLGDSHMIPVIPMIVPYFSMVTYMDNRSNRPVFDEISGNTYTDVLVTLYDKTLTYYLEQNLR